MRQTGNLVERALALAASGNFRTATQVRSALQSEGYVRAQVQPLFEGASFLKTIRKSLREAAGASSGDASDQALPSSVREAARAIQP